MSEHPGPAPGPGFDRRIWIQRGVVIGLWVAVLLTWRAYVSSTGLSATESVQRFVDVVGSAWWGVLAYVAVYVARPLVLFPASLLTIAGGILFGPVVGVLVVVVAANASAMVAYGVGRLLGRPPAGERDQAETLARRWATRMREHSFETVLIMRLVLLPYDLVSYLAGVLRIRWAPFLVATAIGSVPATVAFVLLGASVESVEEGPDGFQPWILVASAVLFVASIALSRLLRRPDPAGADL